MESMEADSTCEISRLPEELLSAAISLTTPLDACRAAAVSRTFCAAANSDAVWSCFLPSNLPVFADEELLRGPLSNKGRFLRLADHPLELADGFTSMWLDKETGVKCFMLSLRKMNRSWGSGPFYWRWSIEGYSLLGGAGHTLVWWMDMNGKIDSNMLSQNSTYYAYLVFNIARSPHGLEHHVFYTARSPHGLEHRVQDIYFTLGGISSIRGVCVNVSINRVGIDDEGCLEAPQNVLLPRERADGWKEVELGEFYNGRGGDAEVWITINDTSATVMDRLDVSGIEIRPKKRV